MAKNITIDILGIETKEVSFISPQLWDINNVPNVEFDLPFDTSNVGLASCSMTGLVNVTSLEYNLTEAGGSEVTTNWKPWAYDSTELPSVSGTVAGQGWCPGFQRDTPLPFTSGGEAHFPGTPLTPGFEMIVDGLFNALAGPYGPPNNNGIIEDRTESSLDVLRYSIEGGAIGFPLSASQAWYSCATTCGPDPVGGFPTTYNPQVEITPGKAIFYGGEPDDCGGPGVYSMCSFYQVVDGLVAGVEYTLTITKLLGDVNGMSAVKMGWSGGLYTDSITSQDYEPLGGVGAPMYGNGGLWGMSGTTGGLMTNGLLTTQAGTQSFDFISIGGNEVINIMYLSRNQPGTYPEATRMEISQISIGEKDKKANLSGIYCNASIINSLYPPAHSAYYSGSGKVEFFLSAGDISSTGIAIFISGITPNQTVAILPNREISADAIVITNNAAVIGGFGGVVHPLVMGLNSFYINNITPTLVGPVSPNRFFNINVWESFRRPCKI